jgi:protein SCO1/2
LVLPIVKVASDAATATDGTPGGGSSAGAGAAAPGGPTASPLSPIEFAAYLLPDPQPAPALALIGPDGQPLTLASMRGDQVLVFFGYTHCPDVCPATIGTVGEAIDGADQDARAILVTVDPERDTLPWLAEFVRYMPAGFTAATGSPSEIAQTAVDWGVRYAKVKEPGTADYAMAHTADTFLVDADGRLRASFPFGTSSATMAAVMDLAEARPVPTGETGSPTPVAPSPSVGPADTGPTARALLPSLTSSAVWSGGDSPLILTLRDADGPLDDPNLTVRGQLLASTTDRVGPIVDAVAVRPVGIVDTSFVLTMNIPWPGGWGLEVTASDANGERWIGRIALEALDPGGTAALGQPAPSIRTPTAADFGGDPTWVTTDPLPDPRLFSTSTADALAAGQPFVLIVDSYRFKVTSVCGTALFLGKGLLDRWDDSVVFIHHEPFRFTVVTTEPVLEGTLAAPHLTEAAEAWGVGAAPWGSHSMPWKFVVDGDGIVRAKYQGVIGSADIDVMLALISQEG